MGSGGAVVAQLTFNQWVAGSSPARITKYIIFYNMLICEYCGKEHNGEYGSGRFCCKSCAAKFSRMFNKDITNNIYKCKYCG